MTEADLDDYLSRQPGHAFGNVVSISGKAMQPISMAAHDAAGNLLDKAVRAFDSGDAERARHFVDRACRIAFDRHEETHPAAWVAHMGLFDLVTDELEASESGDRRWLDAAVAATAEADERGRGEMRDILLAIDAEYELDRGERSALRTAVTDLPAIPTAGDLRFGADELDQLAAIVTSVLALQRAYVDAVDSLEAEDA